MAILSKRVLDSVGKTYHRDFGLRPKMMDLAGRVVETTDEIGVVSGTRRKRNYALQESINRGASFVYSPVPGISTWVVALEDKRMIHGALVGGEVRMQPDGKTEEGMNYLASHGMNRRIAERYFERLPLWSDARVKEAADSLFSTFYSLSGWQPELMRENRLKALQQEQFNQAIEDQRKQGRPSLYAFEKERSLLANIRAGDRNAARKILNEMLATIFMSSPQLPVLRARTIELLSCLTRAAIEDNPLLEPLIERNHAWIERLVHSTSFEDVSSKLMNALDEFVDGVYVHGVNRSNPKVSRAVDFITRNYASAISLRDVAKDVGLSSCRLSHLVKELTGRTVLQILFQVRIQHAQQLLLRTDKPCTEVGYDVGFGDQSYFIKHFKRLTGMTPFRFRRSRAG